MLDCKYLKYKETTPWHGDVFDHPTYEYFCARISEKTKKVIPYITCNPERCKFYKKEED